MSFLFVINILSDNFSIDMFLKWFNILELINIIKTENIVRKGNIIKKEIQLYLYQNHSFSRKLNMLEI